MKLLQDKGSTWQAEITARRQGAETFVSFSSLAPSIQSSCQETEHQRQSAGEYNQ